MIVLGVDPGTAITGFGLVADDGADAQSTRPALGAGRPRLMECGVVRTRPRDPLPSRLREIHDAIAELIERHKPQVLVVEDVFYARNVKTTVALGHARGVVLLAGAQAGLEIREFPPAQIKKAIVGTGAATKDQVQFMLTRLLRLRAAPEPSDAADGVAAAMTFLLTVHLERVAAHSAGARPDAGRESPFRGRGIA